MTASPQTGACPCRPLAGGPATARPVRWLLAGAGVGCVGLGAAGVVIPGLPTTIFLILATWCFARSCPWLERKLVRNRLFKPFLWALDTGAPMPRRARIISTVVMWTAISTSCTLILARASEPLAGPFILMGLIVAAGAVGTWCIWRIAGRARPVSSVAHVSQSGATAAAA